MCLFNDRKEKKDTPPPENDDPKTMHIFIWPFDSLSDSLSDSLIDFKKGLLVFGTKFDINFSGEGILFLLPTSYISVMKLVGYPWFSKKKLNQLLTGVCR